MRRGVVARRACREIRPAIGRNADQHPVDRVQPLAIVPLPHPHPAPALAGEPLRSRVGGAAALGRLARRRGARGRGPRRAAHSRLPGRRRVARHDGAVAARRRLADQARRHARERRVLGGGVHAAGGAARGLAGATGERVVDHRPEPRRRLRQGARRAPPGPRRRASSRSARRCARSSPCIPFVLAQVGVLAALGSGRCPGCLVALPARRLLRALPRARWRARSRPRSATSRSTRARTGSSTGARAWTRTPTPASRSHSSHCGMGMHAGGLPRDRRRAAGVRRRDDDEAGREARPVSVRPRSSSATHSMCGVCGNMSTGRTRCSA